MHSAEINDLPLESSSNNVFLTPSINEDDIAQGNSYTYHSPIPARIAENMAIECALGVDEAGRGPVLGPMVYGLFYLPIGEHKTLLAQTHHFDDSKVLSPEYRSSLLRMLCDSETDLYKTCGWAVRVMAAKDLSAGMLKPAGSYNLNSQAMDATVQLINDVLEKGVNVKEIYIDTIGNPETYQKKLQRIFPAISMTVAKKADSLYPCVSAASVCAKVTRDTALEVSFRRCSENECKPPTEGWGSGYPSDVRSIMWMKRNLDPFFGWGNECRFSWSTARDLLDIKSAAIGIEWPSPDEEHASRMTDYFGPSTSIYSDHSNDLISWFGSQVTEKAFLDHMNGYMVPWSF